MARAVFNVPHLAYSLYILLITARIPRTLTAECKAELSPYYVPTTLVQFKQSTGNGVLNTTAGFNQLWVTRCRILREKPIHKSIQVSATLNVEEEILYKGARLVNLMTRFLPSNLYENVADFISVGIYNDTVESPGVFPEYTPTKECRDTCESKCSIKCTSRGLPVSEEISYDGKLVVVPAGDETCPFVDPVTHIKLQNLLVKQLASSLLKYALTDRYKYELKQAFNSGSNVWKRIPDMNSYFQQATMSWFVATKMSPGTTYGLNQCIGGVICHNEDYARSSIQEKDNLLYNLLNKIFNFGHSYLISGITLCQW